MGGPAALDDILCEVHERTVGRDNCVRFDRLTLQIEPDGARPHYVKAKVTVRRYMDGSLSVWHGPRLLRRYEADGTPPRCGRFAPFPGRRQRAEPGSGNRTVYLF